MHVRNQPLPALPAAIVFAAILLGSQGSLADEVLFSRHVVPTLSRLGCNAGLCHGRVQGEGGLRLSLFGADPKLDHVQLTKEFAGRRVNASNPDSSLMLLKATGQVSHGGGTRTPQGSPEYQLLRDWIAGGAALDSPAESQVTQLTIEPAEHSAKPGETYTLRVMAKFADGDVADVTGLCTFETRDDAIASIDALGRVTVAEIGDTAIVARYRAQPIVSTVLVAGAGIGDYQVAEHNFIDRHVFEKLRLLNIRPAEVCDDATFLRRASLDVTGALPTPDEVRAFLADQSLDKRSRKIAELLERPGYSALWATKFCDVLRPRISYEDFTHKPAPESTRRFYEWIRARLAENTPYDQMAERILTATSYEGRPREAWVQDLIELLEEDQQRGRSTPSKYADRQTLDLYWHRFDSTGVKGAVQVAHAFLGLRLQCAQCHRHPSDVWLQNDLLSFANFFSRVRANTGVLSVQEAQAVKKKAGGGLSPEEKQYYEAEVKRLNEEASKLQEQAKGLNKDTDKAEIERLRAESETLRQRSGVMSRTAKMIDCAAVYHAPGNPFGFANVTSPLGTQSSEEFRLLGETEPIAVADDQDPRTLVAAWLRSKDNPFFARAIVNRVWAHYFGRGLIESVDDLSPLNPPSHPKLLAELCDGFIAHNYDLKWLHRTVLESRAYQLSRHADTSAAKDTRNFAFHYERRLSAEVLLDAINHATGAAEKFNSSVVPPNAKAIEVPLSVLDEAIGSKFVEATFTVFGRSTRNIESLCDCDRNDQPTLMQSLYLVNHPELRKRIESPQGRVAAILKAQSDNAERSDDVYLWTLSRLPTDEERRLCVAYIEQSPTPQVGVAGVMWSLLNTTEFILNH